MSATGRGAIRRRADFYPTPAWCVRRLLERLTLPGGRWLEPAAGDGALIRAVDQWRKVDQWTAMDLRPETEPFLRQLTTDVWIGDSIATLKAIQRPARTEVLGLTSSEERNADPKQLGMFADARPPQLPLIE